MHLRHQQTELVREEECNINRADFSDETVLPCCGATTANCNGSGRRGRGGCGVGVDVGVVGSKVSYDRDCSDLVLKGEAEPMEEKVSELHRCDRNMGTRSRWGKVGGERGIQEGC